MKVSGRVGPGNPAFLPENDASGVNVMVNHECSDTAHVLTVDYRPVDRGGSPVLRQEGGVEIESAELRHCPDLLGKHSECHHHEKVGLEIGQGLQEFRVLEPDRLENRNALLHGELLDCTLIHLQAPSARLVRHGDDAHYIVPAVNEGLQRGDGEFRRAHIYDSCLSECCHESALDFSPPGSEILRVDDG